MKQVPIIFSPEMVPAITAGRKTITRRIQKPKHKVGDVLWVKENYRPLGYLEQDHNSFLISYPADGATMHGILDLRTNGLYSKMLDVEIARRGLTALKGERLADGCQYNIRPSIHMFKAFSRIWLRVKALRSEKLHRITNRDAIAEGVEVMDTFEVNGSIFNTYRNYLDENEQELNPMLSFRSLWIKINGPESWEANPYVWVTEFEVLSTTGRDEFENRMADFIDIAKS